jgi:hypothetical protein
VTGFLLRVFIFDCLSKKYKVIFSEIFVQAHLVFGYVVESISGRSAGLNDQFKQRHALVRRLAFKSTEEFQSNQQRTLKPISEALPAREHMADLKDTRYSLSAAALSCLQRKSTDPLFIRVYLLHLVLLKHLPVIHRAQPLDSASSISEDTSSFVTLVFQHVLAALQQRMSPRGQRPSNIPGDYATSSMEGCLQRFSRFSGADDAQRAWRRRQQTGKPLSRRLDCRMMQRKNWKLYGSLSNASPKQRSRSFRCCKIPAKESNNQRERLLRLRMEAIFRCFPFAVRS